jgi:heterodisulfide reductase subunit C/nitrate reductase gamma subunit
LDYDILGPLFGVHFWHGKFYLGFSLVLDVAGVLLTAGLIYMMYRRGWLRPPKLDYVRPDRQPGDPDYDRSAYRREDWAFLWTLVLIAVTGYFLEAARLVWLADKTDVWDVRWWSPAGALLAEGLRAAGMTKASGGALRLELWWFHGLLALLFIALIPYTKVKHIFTAAGSLMLRDPLAAQRLPRVPEEEKRVGAQYITDFTWKQLLSLDACTKCGRCHEACPARATGAPLSPRDVIQSLREFANRTLSSTNLPPEAELDVHGKGPGQVAMETLWACRTCMACVEVCPVSIEHVPVIVQMRRKLVEDGQMDPQLKKTLQTIHKTGNSFGESRRRRAAWTKALPFPVKDARKERVDVL